MDAIYVYNEETHSDEAAKEVRIFLFGGIRICCGSKELREEDLHSKESWNILVYVLLHRKRECTTSELTSLVHNLDSVEAAKKSVRQRINRFNQRFQQICNQKLITRGGNHGRDASFCINPDLNVWMDFVAYDELLQKARSGCGEEEKIELLKKAIELFKGAAYPSEELADWFIEESSSYRVTNVKIFAELARYMDCKAKYVELYRYAMMFYKAMPDEISSYFWMAYCLKRLKRENDVQRILHEAKERLSMEEGELIKEQLKQKNAIDEMKNNV